MASEDRPSMDLGLWASDSNLNYTFPGSTKIKQGWVNEVPTFQMQNWWQWRADQQLRANEIGGIPQFNDGVAYKWGAFCMDGLNLYRSRTTNSTDPESQTQFDNWPWSRARLDPEITPGYSLIDGYRCESGLAKDTDIHIEFGGILKEVVGSGSYNGFWLDRPFENNTSKGIDNTWAVGAGIGSGGYPTWSGPALAADTWYGLFAIMHNHEWTPDFGFDVEHDASNLLVSGGGPAIAGFDRYRRIGWAKTEKLSTTLEHYYSDPNDVKTKWWEAPGGITDYDEVANGTSYFDVDCSAPPGSTAIVEIIADFNTETNASNTLIYGRVHKQGLTEGAIPDDTSYNLLWHPAAASVHSVVMEIPVHDNPSGAGGHFRMRLSDGDFRLIVKTLGWRDGRGVMI